MDGLWFWGAGIVAAALVGMAKGGVPVVGMLAVPVMALVMSPVLAAGLLLPVFVVSDVFGLWAYRHAFDRRVLALTLPGAVAGIGLGWATASLVPEAVVTLLVGVIGLAFALNTLLRQPVVTDPKRAKALPGAVWGGLPGSPALSAMPVRRPGRSILCPWAYRRRCSRGRRRSSSRW